jgi:hypothetical protein
MAKANNHSAQLVALARQVERLVARRRRFKKQVREVEHELRTARRFLAALAMPSPTPLNHGERGELLPGEGE